MRRTAITAMMAALLAAALGLPAQAQQRPQIETKKIDGTENVYLFRNGNHQSIFVVTPAGVIATDPVAYGRPTGGQQHARQGHERRTTGPRREQQDSLLLVLRQEPA